MRDCLGSQARFKCLFKYFIQENSSSSFNRSKVMDRLLEFINDGPMAFAAKDYSTVIND